MNASLWLLNVAIWTVTGLCAAAGGYIGTRHALRNARQLPPRG